MLNFEKILDPVNIRSVVDPSRKKKKNKRKKDTHTFFFVQDFKLFQKKKEKKTRHNQENQLKKWILISPFLNPTF